MSEAIFALVGVIVGFMAYHFLNKQQIIMEELKNKEETK